MSSDSQRRSVSKAALITGWVLGVIPAGMMVLSAMMKVTQNPMAVDGFAKGGYPAYALVPIGVVELACVVLYLFPRTAVLGAILMVGYLGGAVDVHVRAGEPFWIPVALGVVAWLGLLLRDARIRELLPLRRPVPQETLGRGFEPVMREA